MKTPGTGMVYKEQSWDIGDGFSRWTRGISLPRLLITLVKPEWFTYVAGCHIKHVKAAGSTIEVLRVFHPGCEGIALIEGYLKMQVYALAETGKNNRIVIYRADKNEDVLMADLKGQPDYDYISVQFTKKDLLVVLTGIPHFTIFVWKWTLEQQLIAVSTLERVPSTNIAISGLNHHLWAEWSKNHLTFYELQEYTEKNVNMTEIQIPLNKADLLYPDPRGGKLHSFDILSVTWTHSGELFALNDSNGLYKVNLPLQQLVFAGQIDEFEPDESFYEIVPYDNSCLGVLGRIGSFLIVQVRSGKPIFVKKITFRSQLIKYLPIPTAVSPKTSFYAITDVERTTEYVLNGKISNSFVLTDLLLSQILSVCFIERDADYIAVITERGFIYILDAATGNIHAQWNFPFVATSILCHPIHPFVAVGTVNGYIYYIEIKNIREPRIIHQVYVMRAVLDKLEWMGRGRLLIAADSNEGYLFLLHALATTDFDYLDCAHVAGYIRAINVPANYKDQRLQVVSNYHRNDEVPFLLNNFHLETDYFELVSSQQFDTPISTLCFSPFKSHLYAFTYTTRKIGMVTFSEELQAGSLKEPHTLFNCEHPLDVNHMVFKGDRLFTFGLDGFAMQHAPPVPKQTPEKPPDLIQTHFAGHGGIRQGVVSLNGCNFIALGFDNTIVHVKLRKKPDKVNWSVMGYGIDVRKVAEQQKKYYAELTIDPEIATIVESDEDGHGVIWDLNGDEDQEVLLRYTPEKEDMMVELAGIRAEVVSLMEFNETRDEADQLEIEAFEVNEEATEDMDKDFEARFLHLKIIISTLFELRQEWIQLATMTTYDRFASVTCRIKGFKFDREVENYVQHHVKHEFIQEVIAMKNTRRLEKKLKKSLGEIYLTGYTLHSKWSALMKTDKPQRDISLAIISMPLELQGHARQLLEEMDTPTLASPGPPSPPPLDFYQRLLKRLEENKGLKRGEDGDTEDEDEEEESDEDEDEHGDKVRAGSKSGPSLSKFEQLIAAAVAEEAAENEEEEEPEEEEEARPRIDPDIIKFILAEAGIPMSAQALAAQGKIPLEVALQVRQDEIDANLHKRRRRRKYNPKRKIVNQMVYQLRSKAKDEPVIILTSDKAKKEKEKAAVVPVSAKESKAGEFVVNAEGHEDESQNLVANDRDKKKLKVVKGEDPISGKEIIEVVVDSSDDSGAEAAEEDMKILEERALAESALTKIEKVRHTLITRMLVGNLTWRHYPTSLVFYSQAELYSILQTRGQMILIQAEIRKLQDIFNGVFQEAKAFKGFQIQSIKTRNERIREISEFFGLHVNIEDVVLDPEEDVIQVFTVNDDEVPCERYLDAEGRRLAELARLAEVAKLKAYDDFRDRALIKMMDGVLIKRREDILKKDVPKPDFMLIKEQWEWNYDEYMKADEYYRQVEQHEMMRTLFRRELEVELRVLVRSNKQTKNQFDNRLRALFRYKTIIERNIQMEELKWFRLQRHIYEYYKLHREFDRKKGLMKKAQETMKYSQELAAQIIARVEDCSRRYEEILERDHTLEISFREEMGPEVEKFHMDQFYKLYRKRPKLIVPRNQLLDLTVMMIKALQTPNLRWFSHENGELGQKAVNAIYEFDNPFFNPQNCPRTTWERFVHIRRQRLVCEYEAKALASDLVELQSVLEECDNRIEECSEELAIQLGYVGHHRECIMDLVHDVEMQLMMKHGKVELESSKCYEDFEDIVLTGNKGVVKCNMKIMKEGALKMASLHKLKRVHKQLKIIEWNFKRIHLTEKHLLIREKDILQMRVSKEILNFLQEHDNFLLVQEQKLMKVHVFQKMAETFHNRFLIARGKVLKLWQKLVARKAFDNEEKDTFLDQRNLKVNIELNSCVRENQEMLSRFHEDRIQMLMKMGQMMRKIAKYAIIVCQLESELDRLYQRTYPVL